ncbi:hypothetical protein HPC49_03315 [Pyxidicoccus fallax]|uniref:Lipoprotein n=1 Tax=Pyxidicoccus fallax TaxID=394095 RepID=A0A848LHA5_9BACT|nr:hypothetical protein [Pyxidicoccus fallax]NMO15748.1 hypothetical protein [Pyxidicoccus fallax]NPC77286.1 hypothetical protein [Pyxidicoccus fallax]
MGPSRLWLLVLLVTLAGCKSEQERHLEALEADWRRTSGNVPAGDAERVAHFEAFLQRFPAQHPHGNPHAAQARQQLEEARTQLRERLAAEEQRRRLAESVRPVIEEALFLLAGRIEDIWRDTHVARLEHAGVHLVTRGTFMERAWMRLKGPPLTALRKTLGASIYDTTKKRYDPDALAKFLDVAWLPPDTPLLGTLTQKLYPVFRRRLRYELLLYTSLAKNYAPRREELEKDFGLLQLLQRNHRLGDPVSYWAEVRHRGEKDRRLFYGYLYYRQNVDGLMGIAPGEVDHLDVGFWVRRFEDGTARMLGDFLRKVAQAYDAAWLASVDAGAFKPFMAEKAWIHSEYSPWRDASQIRYHKTWPKGDGIEHMLGEDPEPTFITHHKLVRFDPPEPPEEFHDTTTGDRLLRLPTELRSIFQGPEPRQLVGLMKDSKVFELDPTSLEQRSKLSNHYELEITGVLAMSPDGGFLVAGARRWNNGDSSPRVVIENMRNGAREEEMYQSLTATTLATSEKAAIVAGQAGDETEVRFRIQPERERLLLKTRGPLALHPTLPLLVSGEQATELWDLDTGTLVQTFREETPVKQRAFDASGRYLSSFGAKAVYLDTFDAEARKLVAGKKLAAGTPTGQWLPGAQGHLLVHDGSVARVVDAGSGETVGRSVRALGVLGTFHDGKALLRGLNGSDAFVWSFELPPPPEAEVADSEE